MTTWTWRILVAEQYGPSACFRAWFRQFFYPLFGKVTHDRDMTLSRLMCSLSIAGYRLMPKVTLVHPNTCSFSLTTEGQTAV